MLGIVACVDFQSLTPAKNTTSMQNSNHYLIQQTHFQSPNTTQN